MRHTEQGSPHVQASVSARYAIMVFGRYAAQNCRAHFFSPDTHHFLNTFIVPSENNLVVVMSQFYWSGETVYM